MTAKTTSDDGRTERILGDKPEYLKVLIGEGGWTIHTTAYAFQAEAEDEEDEEDDEDDEEDEEDENE